MTPPTPPPDTLLLPDPDALQTAIATADERTRLLRRLLRLALRLRLSLTTADRIPAPVQADGKGVARGGSSPRDPPGPKTTARKRRKLPPLVVDAKGLARLLTCGVRTVRTLDAGGKLPTPLRIGGRVVWRTAEVRAWLAAGAPPRAEWEARKAARRS